MGFLARYAVAVTVLAVVDGALLGGVAAVISSVGGIVLGLIAYRRGQMNGNGGWKALARDRLHEIHRLEKENARLRA